MILSVCGYLLTLLSKPRASGDDPEAFPNCKDIIV